jgi:hypothetical protein
MSTFNLKRDAGIDAVRIQAMEAVQSDDSAHDDCGKGACPQCNGLGMEDTGKICRKCKGSCVFEKVAEVAEKEETQISAEAASMDPAIRRVAEDWSKILEDVDGDEDLLDVSDEEFEAASKPGKIEVSLQSPYEPPIPLGSGATPDQIKNNIVSMLSASSTHLISLIFDHISDFNGVGEAERQAFSHDSSGVNPSRMLDFIYEKVDIMEDVNDLKRVYSIIRENE